MLVLLEGKVGEGYWYRLRSAFELEGLVVQLLLLLSQNDERAAGVVLPCSARRVVQEALGSFPVLQSQRVQLLALLTLSTRHPDSTSDYHL